MNDSIHMRLSEASLCCDCLAISNSLRACWACASVNIMPLACTLDRDTCVTAPCVTVGSSYPSISMEAI